MNESKTRILVLVLAVLFVAGIWVYKNTDLVDDLYQKSYSEQCESNLLALGRHYEDIGVLETVKDKYGQDEEIFVYSNVDMDFVLLDNTFESVLDDYDLLKSDLDAGIEISDRVQKNFYYCYKSTIFTVYPEKLERSFDDYDYELNAKFLNEVENLNNDEWFVGMLQNNKTDKDSDYSKYQNLLSLFSEYREFMTMEEKLDALDIQYDEFDENDPGFEEFELLYDKAIDEVQIYYETNISKQVFAGFMNLINVNLIFPQQAEIEMVNTDDEEGE